MTTPTAEAYEAAARAYCVTRFDYLPTAYVSDEARRRHIANDARDTAGESWLRAAVDAVWPIAAVTIESEVRAKVAAELRNALVAGAKPPWAITGRVVRARDLAEWAAKIAEGSTDG